MSLVDTLVAAWQGVMANKLRAALTTLGIIIGVASVIATLALGNGARAAVEANFRYLGSDTVQISVRQALDHGVLVPAGKILSYDDGLRLPEAVPAVNRVEMSVRAMAKVRYGRATLDLAVTGTTADALETVIAQGQVQPINWPDKQKLVSQALLGYGRFLSPAEVLGQANVCVLGYQTALDLFGSTDPIGQTVWISRRPYEVIGVLVELEMADPEERNRSAPNDALYLPISSAIQDLYEKEPSVNIVAHVSDESRIDSTKAQIQSYLRQQHEIVPTSDQEYPDDFDLTTRKDILGAQQESARIFALLLAAMAAVSLVVGGIGIMNVMLVSVSERTREIGVRLAVGARRRDVVHQFLFEALLLSAGGGVLGVAAGVLAIPLAAMLNHGMALLSPESIPLSFSVALAIGLLFGIYPAVRASRLDPIEALRYE